MKLKELLDNLSAAATPSAWNPNPKRLMVGGMEGPLMSYLVGDRSSADGMVVSLGSERIADHRLVAALVNSYRAGELIVRDEPQSCQSSGNLANSSESHRGESPEIRKQEGK